jgi:hypothetical protein
MNEKSNFADSQVVRDAQTGRPRKIRGDFELPVADTAEDMVKSFLFANADELGLAMQANDLNKIQDVATPTGRVVQFEQMHDGIRILGTEIQVRLDGSSRVRQIDLAHVPPGKIIEPAGDEKVLTTAAAIKVARDVLGEHTLRQKVAKPEKVYFPQQEGLRLAYEVLVLTGPPPHDWHMIIDAYTGAILAKQDLIWKVNGQGLVFDPNPVVTASNNTFRDPTATPATCGFAGTPQAIIDSQRVLRSLNGITLSGGKHKLEGPYVKLRNFGAPNVLPPEESNANDFEYASNNDSFEAVMVYYHIDTLQRYIQGTLGITTANNRQTEADAHDGIGGGAFYSPGDKGLHFGDSGLCRPDRAEDADCIYHEDNHAIMDNVKPGYGPWGVANPVTGRRESRAIGEGFSDILPCVYFAPDHPYQREVFEDWVFSFPPSGGPPTGLRRVDGTKVYPTNWVNEEHDDGEIWSAALWNIYRAIGGDAASNTIRRMARDEMLKTMISSYFALTINPNMMDAAETMMDTNGDLPEYRLAHGIEMLDSFHDRGVLHCETGSNLKVIELWSQQSEWPAAGWEKVEAGQDNWFYARVRNDGTVIARAFVVEFSFKSPFSTPVYPADFRDHIISGAVGYDLAPGATTTVRARWPKELIPAIPTGATRRHGCLFAEVYNPADHVPAGVTTIGASNGKLRQRNTDIVNLLPDATVDYFLTISNYHIARPQLVRFELVRPSRWENLEVTLHHHNPRVIKALWEKMEVVKPTVVEPVEILATRPEVRVLEATRVAVGVGPNQPQLLINLARGSSFVVPDQPAAKADDITDIREDFFRRDAELISQEEETFLKLYTGLQVGWPYLMLPRERLTLRVRIRVPKDARPGDQIKVEVLQRDARGNEVGGFDVLVNVVAGNG